MGLEAGTFINDLVTANPPGTDPILQGDDHLRLIKSVLKATFPNATKAFYFQDFVAKSANYTILASEMNKYFGGASAGGAFAFTLPALAAGDAGWSIIIFKTDTSQNAITVVPSAGTINGEASLRLSNIFDALRVVWSGTAWTAIRMKSALRIRSITADITVAEADLESLILCTPAANTTITLPAVANYIGRWLSITHITSGAFTTTIDGNGAETVNGAATLVMGLSRNTLTLIATTTGWEVIGGASTSAASTTETLTGIDTAKFVTPDGLAALWEKGSDIASAATITIGEGGYHHVTGTTSITDIDFGTAKDGRPAILVFDGSLTLTHNGTTLVLPTAANIQTAAGDVGIFVQDNGDNVKCIHYMRADGTSLGSSGVTGTWTLIATINTTSGTTITQALGAAYKQLHLNFTGVSGGGASSNLGVQLSDDGATFGATITLTPNTGGGTATNDGVADIFNTGVTGTKYVSSFASESTGNTTKAFRGAEASETGVTTHIKLIQGSGNFDAGTCAVYGMV